MLLGKDRDRIHLVPSFSNLPPVPGNIGNMDMELDEI